MFVDLSCCRNGVSGEDAREWLLRGGFRVCDFGGFCGDRSMGCGGSKVDDLPLVMLCRERKELIRVAADHRYALAASHFSYFRSLKDVGDALWRFVDEELVIGVASSSLDSPIFTVSLDELIRKNRKKKKKSKEDSKSSSSLTSISSSHLYHHNQHSMDFMKLYV